MVKKPRMRVIAAAATKGGCGKTSLSISLSVRAAEESKRVALLDLDPQESLIAWWERRGHPKNPKIHQMDATVEGVELLIREGWDWVFIDTAPAKLEYIEPGIAVADFVLIPCRPSPMDVEQAPLTVELCKIHKKPFAFVLNHAAQSWKLTKSTASELRKLGPVIDAVIPFRQAYMSAPIIGKSAAELAGDGTQAKKDIEALWASLQKLLEAPHGRRA